MKHVLRVANALAVVVIVVAFLVLLRTVFTPAGQIPTFGGYGVMRTLTGSMEPEIPVHSLIVVKEVDPSDLAVGDVITFHSTDGALEGSLNTHRITGVSDQGGSLAFRTKGDANAAEDADLVPAANVVGRVVFVSAGLGVVVSLLTNPLVFFPFIVVPLIVLAVVEVVRVVKATREVARAEEEEALRLAVEALQRKRANEAADREAAADREGGPAADTEGAGEPGPAFDSDGVYESASCEVPDVDGGSRPKTPSETL